MSFISKIFGGGSKPSVPAPLLQPAPTTTSTAPDASATAQALLKKRKTLLTGNQPFTPSVTAPGLGAGSPLGGS